MYENVELLADPKINRGIRVNGIREKIQGSTSKTLEHELRHLADNIKTVLVDGEWREYVDAYVSHGQYGTDNRIAFHGTGTAPLRFASFNKWIENGLGLIEPKKKKPIDRLIHRIEALFPVEVGDNLKKAVLHAATQAGEPMTKQEQRKLAIETRWEPDTIIINNDRITNPVTEQNSIARHLNQLQHKSPDLYEKVIAGETTVGKARQEAGLTVKAYAFNATTKPSTLAANIHQAFASNPEKIVELIKTLVISQYQDKICSEYLTQIIADLSQVDEEASCI